MCIYTHTYAVGGPAKKARGPDSRDVSDVRGDKEGRERGDKEAPLEPAEDGEGRSK